MREDRGAHRERFGIPAERRDGARRRLSGDAEATRDGDRHATRWSSRRGSATVAATGRGTRRNLRRWLSPVRLTLRPGNRLTTATITVNFFRLVVEQVEMPDAARVTETGTVGAAVAYAGGKMIATEGSRRRSTCRQRRAAKPAAVTRHGFATGTVAEHGPVRCGSWRSEEPARAAREAEGVGDGGRSGPRVRRGCGASSRQRTGMKTRRRRFPARAAGAVVDARGDD